MMYMHTFAAFLAVLRLARDPSCFCMEEVRCDSHSTPFGWRQPLVVGVSPLPVAGLC